MDDLRKVYISDRCSCCGQELPEHLKNLEWIEELKELLTRSDDPNHRNLDGWSKQELHELYLFFKRKSSNSSQDGK